MHSLVVPDLINDTQGRPGPLAKLRQLIPRGLFVIHKWFVVVMWDGKPLTDPMVHIGYQMVARVNDTMQSATHHSRCHTGPCLPHQCTSGATPSEFLLVMVENKVESSLGAKQWADIGLWRYCIFVVISGILQTAFVPVEKLPMIT